MVKSLRLEKSNSCNLEDVDDEGLFSNPQDKKKKKKDQNKILLNLKYTKMLNTLNNMN